MVVVKKTEIHWTQAFSSELCGRGGSIVSVVAAVVVNVSIIAVVVLMVVIIAVVLMVVIIVVMVLMVVIIAGMC